MRDLQEELSRLREKLRRVESRTTLSGDNRVGSRQPNVIADSHAEVPPWESCGEEVAFERSLVPAVLKKEPSLQYKPGASIEECLTGVTLATSHGTHFLVETLYPLDASHGQFALSDLARQPGNLLNPLCPEHGGEPVERWAFLDTETTGLAGGAGTFAFLVGLGSLTAEGFLVRQYFLKEPKDEPSVLHHLAEDLGRFSTVITYNGKGYDLPLLETRYRLARAPVPFMAMPHLDLLHACRRLWKLRFESCKLTFLEERILGNERVGDVPGFLIPSLYANYLRFQDAGSLVPVFMHNALDILSLACLTSVVAGVFADPAQVVMRHGAECIGLARWLTQAGRAEEALHLFRKAINTNIPEDLLARTLWDIFEIERKQQRFEAAREALEQMLGFPNTHHGRALEALSILLEHRFKDVPRALHYARRLEMLQPSEKVGARLERLVKKLGKARRGEIFGAS